VELVKAVRAVDFFNHRDTIFEKESELSEMGLKQTIEPISRSEDESVRREVCDETSVSIQAINAFSKEQSQSSGSSPEHAFLAKSNLDPAIEGPQTPSHQADAPPIIETTSNFPCKLHDVYGIHLSKCFADEISLLHAKERQLLQDLEGEKHAREICERDLAECKLEISTILSKTSREVEREQAAAEMQCAEKVT
jgi:hypothetical protein